MKAITRRGLLKGSAAIATGSVLPIQAGAVVLTPSATEGPFYPTTSMRSPDVDSDLVKVTGLLEQAGGEILWLLGKIISKQGEPLVNHRIEIWQCDVNGKYMHPDDNQHVAYDNGFQGYGHDVTDGGGNYRFRTIVPAKYPGRAPHIHVKVFNGESELLTTQFYIAKEASNNTDGLYGRMSSEQARSVSMVISTRNGTKEARIDVVV